MRNTNHRRHDGAFPFGNPRFERAGADFPANFDAGFGGNFGEGFARGGRSGRGQGDADHDVRGGRRGRGCGLGRGFARDDEGRRAFEERGGFGAGFPGGHREGGRGPRGFAMGPRGFDDDFGGAFGGGFGGGMGGRGGGRGPGGRGPGGGGRRRRVMDQSELQIVLLELIAETPRHGYDLIREIESMTNGEYAPSPGVVYPALTYMEEAGLIAAVQEDGARKSFAVTEEGKARVAQDAGKAEAIRKRLIALGDVRDRLDPAPVRRALHALRTAVIDRLSQGGADRDLVLAIADTLDEATRTVERLEAGAQPKGTEQ